MITYRKQRGQWDDTRARWKRSADGSAVTTSSTRWFMHEESVLVCIREIDSEGLLGANLKIRVLFVDYSYSLPWTRIGWGESVQGRPKERVSEQTVQSNQRRGVNTKCEESKLPLS